jgi:hypothetical protein
VVDFLWVAIAVGALLLALLLVFSVVAFVTGAKGRIWPLDLVLGAIGLIYVAIVIVNGGFLFLIGAIASVGLLALGLIGRRRLADASAARR